MKKILIASAAILLCGCGAASSSDSQTETAVTPEQAIQTDAEEKEINTGYGITLILPGDVQKKEFENCDFSYGNDSFDVLGLSESREYLACIGENPEMNIQEYAESLFEDIEVTQIDDKRAAAEAIHNDYYEYETVIEGEDRFWTVGFIQKDFDEETKTRFKTYAAEKTLINGELPSERKTFTCNRILLDLPRQFKYSEQSYYEKLECGYVSVIIYDFSLASGFAELASSEETDAVEFALAVQDYMGEKGDITKIDDGTAYYSFESDSYYVTEYIFDYGPGFANIEYSCPAAMKDTMQKYYSEWAATIRKAE